MHQEAYDKAPGLRRSDLWKINKSPHHFKTHMESEREDTASLKFGIATHKYILEPNTFFDEYAIAPKVDKRTKAGKETWLNFAADCDTNNKEPLDQKDFDIIKAMADAVNADPLAKQMLTGQHELEFYWTDPMTQEPLKCKCDNIGMYNGKKIIVDYKTTDSCEDGHFERSSKRYGYQFQTGFYTEGVFQSTGEACGFAFVAQEKKPPYACRVYLCSDMYVEKGKMIYHQLLDLYHQCTVTNDWFGYEGSSANPQPTELMDDSERYSNNYGYGNQVYTETGFRSDDYLEEPDIDSDYSDI